MPKRNPDAGSDSPFTRRHLAHHEWSRPIATAVSANGKTTHDFFGERARCHRVLTEQNFGGPTPGYRWRSPSTRKPRTTRVTPRGEHKHHTNEARSGTYAAVNVAGTTSSSSIPDADPADATQRHTVFSDVESERAFPRCRATTRRVTMPIAPHVQRCHSQVMPMR